MTLFGTPPPLSRSELDDPRTHEHAYVPWRRAPGSDVTGWYCRGCDDLQVD